MSMEGIKAESLPYPDQLTPRSFYGMLRKNI